MFAYNHYVLLPLLIFFMSTTASSGISVSLDEDEDESINKINIDKLNYPHPVQHNQSTILRVRC